MVRKLKQIAGGAGGGDLAGTVRDSAQQIWLAGLGAFAKAQGEGMKVFNALVKEGEAIHSRTRKITERKVGEVTNAAGKFANQASSKANATWDKLEQVFEDRVARALNRLGVPTNRDIQGLARRVEELNASVRSLGRGGAAKGATRKPAKRKAAAK
jgi:poly(hydroxyalkanoate) granule-associated protein